ncbi:MAG: NBR1-Ig-like domain-containing protein [Anaerolineae bacterium]
MRHILLVSIALLLILALIGCQNSTASTNKPTVVINSPPSGSTYHVGDDVPVNSTANDAQGVTRVELQVDGATVRMDPSPVAQGQAQFSLIQTWKAAGAGTHNIIVRAYNSAGAFSDTGLTITVAEAVAAAEPSATTFIATVVPPPTSAPASTNAPTSIPPTAIPTNTNTPAPIFCTPSSQYIADVTIPDGTVVSPGASFTKTWRVRNNGTCAWDNSYAITFVGGTPLASGAAPIPTTAPGAVVDISLTMTAPNSYGTFSGSWQLHAPNGALFGTNLTTVINVPNPNAPTATSTPAATSTNTPLPGAPNISSFSCSPCTIVNGNSATLNWGAVTNATNVSIDPGIGGVATPGNKSFPLSTTTTFILTASGPGGTTQASVTITVVGNFAGHWNHNFGFMDLTQNGANVTGTYYNALGAGNGSIAGTVAGNTLTGTRQYGATGTIQFTLGSGNTFTGNWNGSNQWCGARSGVSFPSGCGFDGQWNTKYGPTPYTACTMNLSQVGNTVTGTYCNGQIQNGVITYAGAYAKLAGTWWISAINNGPFVFYLLPFSSQQFQGDYNTTIDWCGWRNGSSAPTPCGK